jgi:hypothetical protein
MVLGPRLSSICLFRGSLVRSRLLLALLQLLLLLSVFLRQLFGLLLMLLLERLLSRFIDRLLREALMIPILFCLKRLAFLDLLRLELVLLLLIFPIRLRIACVGSGAAFCRGDISGMDSGAGAIGIDGRTSRFRVGTILLVVRTGIVFRSGWGGVNCATFSGGYCSAFLEAAWAGCGSDRRFSVIGGGTQLRVAASGLEMLVLRGDGRRVPFVCEGFLP